MALPIAACGLALDNDAVRVAVGLRLGLALCTPHRCQCGDLVGSEGHHGFVCRRASGRSLRHHAINDIIWRALLKADVPSTKEPAGLFRSDGKRPDGATLIPYVDGREVPGLGRNGRPHLCGLLHRRRLGRARFSAGGQP